VEELKGILGQRNLLFFTMSADECNFSVEITPKLLNIKKFENLNAEFETNEF
jgi:hypothetical protein